MILEVLNDLRLQYFVASGIAAIAFSLLRRKLHARWPLWISLGLLGVNAIAIVPWYLPQFNSPQHADGQPCRLLFINVKNQNRDYTRVIDWVHHEQPDIAVFSEVISTWNPWSKQLSVLQEEWPYHIRQEEMDIEVYSRWPLSIRHEQSYGNGKDLKIIRGFVVLDVDVNGTPAIAIATHAFPKTFYGRPGFELRNQHLKELGEYVAALSQQMPDASVMLTGDLNATPWSPYYDSLVNDSGLKDARRGFGLLPSQSGFMPHIPIFAIPIDHSFVSPTVEVSDIYTGPNVGSDHLPLTTDMVLPESSLSIVRIWIERLTHHSSLI